MKIFAVIPAAGLGSRLNSSLPKILTRISKAETIWSLLRRKLLSVVQHINLIVSPTWEPLFREMMQVDITNNIVSLSLQTRPIGMGDAVFCGYSVWSQADIIIVVWGDQLFISENTLISALKAHAGTTKTVALPLTMLNNPYVEYLFQKEKLISVKQSREGDQLSLVGLADVGTFVLSVQDLLQEWNNYLEKAPQGSSTKEINFLPFLTWLSTNNWAIKQVPVQDTLEARGINTQEDLNFFKNMFEAM